MRRPPTETLEEAMRRYWKEYLAGLALAFLVINGEAFASEISKKSETAPRSRVSQKVKGPVRAYKVKQVKKSVYGPESPKRRWIVSPEIYRDHFIERKKLIEALNRKLGDREKAISVSLTKSSVKHFKRTGRGVFTETHSTPPQKAILYQSDPNPFLRATRINFFVPTRSRVTLSVINEAGQKVRELLKGEISPGFHYVYWDGKDNRGNCTPGGVYFYVLKIGPNKYVKKMVKLNRGR